MPRKNKSPILELLSVVWDNALDATGHSWERLNHSMHKALELAIGAGFEFSEDDFKLLTDGRYRHGYWIGDSEEWCYSLAICTGNVSAAKSYEAWKSRLPFIADNVDPGERYDAYAHSVGSRQKERLHVGCCFPWKGHKVKVTSFSDDGQSLTACAYRPSAKYESKIARRFRITRDDLIADRIERKARERLRDEIVKHPRRQAILNFLAVSKDEDFETLPLDKIKKAMAKFKAE